MNPQPTSSHTTKVRQLYSAKVSKPANLQRNNEYDHVAKLLVYDAQHSQCFTYKMQIYHIVSSKEVTVHAL